MAELDLPEGAVLLNELRFVEYLTAEGPIHFDEVSGEEVDYPKFLEMIAWAQAKRQARVVAMYVAELCEEDED